MEHAATPSAEHDPEIAVLCRAPPFEAATILQTFAFYTHLHASFCPDLLPILCVGCAASQEDAARFRRRGGFGSTKILRRALVSPASSQPERCRSVVGVLQARPEMRETEWRGQTATGRSRLRRSYNN